MASDFKKGDKVKWNSSGGESVGKVVKVHTSDVEFMGQQRRASKDEPQYEVESETSGDRAMHHGDALSKA